MPEETLDNPNREVKDSLFTKLFNREDTALELFNAITGSQYSIADIAVVIKTLSDVFYRLLKNDLAFLIDNRLIILMEHQSSLNPNMALRLLLYVASIYKSLVSQRSLYSGKKLPIPRPEFFVLYNGEEELENETELKLSDLFEEVPGHEGVDLELKVRVININLGHNEGMMARSEHLRGYAIITEKIREYTPKGKMSEEERKTALGKAIKKAIEYCVEHGILVDFIKENAGEVMNMLTMEFDINVAEKIWREEGLEEGLEKGREEGLEKGREEGLEKGREEEKEKIIKNLLSLGVNVEQIAKAAELDVEKVRDYTRN